MLPLNNLQIEWAKIFDKKMTNNEYLQQLVNSNNLDEFMPGTNIIVNSELFKNTSNRGLQELQDAINDLPYPPKYLKFSIKRLSLKATYCYYTNDYEKGLSLCNRAINLINQKDFYSYINKNLKNANNFYVNLLIEEYLIYKNGKAMAMVYYLKSEMYRYTGKYELALKYNELAYNLDNQPDYFCKKLDIISNISIDNFEQEIIKMIEKYKTFTEKEEVFDNIDIFISAMKIFIEKMIKNKEYGKALHAINNIYKYIVFNPHAIYRYYLWNGQCYKALGEHEKALNFLQDGIEYMKKYEEFLKLTVDKEDESLEEITKEYINIKHIILTEKCGFRLLYSGKTGIFNSKNDIKEIKQEVFKKVRGTDYVEYLLKQNPIKIYEGCIIFAKDMLYRIYEYSGIEKVIAESSQYGNATYIADKKDWYKTLTVNKQEAIQNEKIERYNHTDIKFWKNKIQLLFKQLNN